MRNVQRARIIPGCFRVIVHGKGLAADEALQGRRYNFVADQGIVMRQQMGAQHGVGTIAWTDIYEWYNTPEFLLINFKAKGQQGAYILPARMNGKNFSFKTIRKHLNETVGAAKPV